LQTYDDINHKIPVADEKKRFFPKNPKAYGTDHANSSAHMYFFPKTHFGF
jgi:hypothetical protein